MHDISNPSSLNALLYPDFDALRAAHVDLDSRIVAWALEIQDEDLALDLEHTKTIRNPSAISRFCISPLSMSAGFTPA